MTIRQLLPLTGLLLLVPGGASANAPDSGAQDPRIFQGMPVPTCGWPTTVAIQGGGGLCTGTLVSPEVVVYAAHCGGGAKTVRFSEDTIAGKQIQASCTTNPGYNNQGTDWAFCVLPEPVDLPVTPVVYGCEESILQVGQEVVIAGFGNTSGMGGSAMGAGTKRWDNSIIGAINWGTNTVNMNGYCEGDSGGPSFVKFPDPANTWHALSIVSTGQCGGNGTHSLMGGAVPWIEETSGKDITPCFDDDGEWAPNPTCAGFFAGSEQGTGTWSNWCEGTPAGGSHGTCGDPYDANPDDTAPAVVITSPETGTVYDEDPATVDITIDAADEGWGVRFVWLEINGSDQPQIESPPYAFNGIPFPGGGYTVYAFAEDWAGNIGQSEAVTFGVGQDAPEPPPPMDGDESGEGDSGDGDSGEAGTGTGPSLDGGDEGGGESGCGCSSTPSPIQGLTLLLLGLVGLRRRRY